MHRQIFAVFIIFFSIDLYSTNYANHLDEAQEVIDDSIFTLEDAVAVFNITNTEKISIEECIYLTVASGTPAILIRAFASLGAELICPTATASAASNFLCDICNGATSMGSLCLLGSLCTPVGVALYNYWITHLKTRCEGISHDSHYVNTRT